MRHIHCAIHYVIPFDSDARVFLCSSIRTFPLDFCSEMTDIIFHGRRRENYNSPTIESRLKASFMQAIKSLRACSEMLVGGGRKNQDREGKWLGILFNKDTVRELWEKAGGLRSGRRILCIHSVLGQWFLSCSFSIEIHHQIHQVAMGHVTTPCTIIVMRKGHNIHLLLIIQ